MKLTRAASLRAGMMPLYWNDGIANPKCKRGGLLEIPRLRFGLVSEIASEIHASPVP